MRHVVGFIAASLLLLTSFDTGTARAQLAIDTGRGLVGCEVRVGLHLVAITPGVRYRVAGQIKLGNSTVFFPERFVALAGDSLAASRLSAITDSLYEFSFDLTTASAIRPAGDTLVQLAGEALAGSDSVCTLELTAVTVNDIQVVGKSGAVVTRSIGPPLPYIRFATLEQNFPNPIRRGQSTTWGYRIDKPSDVRFIFYNALGQELEIVQLGLIGIGPHTFAYRPGPTAPSGVYWARLVTSTGMAEQPFHIVR